MRAMDDDLQSLAARANLDDELVDYQDFNEVDSVIYAPLEAGMDVNGKTYKVEAADAAICKAVLRYLWKLCSDALAAPKSESQGTKTIAPVANRSSSAKGPLQNKSYTPLELHELMIHRYFDSAGNTNPLWHRPSRRSTRVVLDMTSNTAQTTEEAQWTPKGVLSLLDSLDAIQRCLVLTQISHEMHVMNYVAWWRQLVRSKASRIDQLKAFWLECSWKMCVEMRQNKPFEEVTKDIMSDTAELQTALQREVPTKPTPPKQPPRGGGRNPHRDQGPISGAGLWWPPELWFLMSALDGLGSARLAAASLQPEVPPPLAYISWEVDPDLQTLTSKAWNVNERGDMFQETFQDMESVLDGLDPDRSAAVILTVSPTHLDFTETIGKDGNHEGDISPAVLDEWLLRLQHHLGGRPIKRLIQCTVPHRNWDVASLEHQLKRHAVIMDAAEFGRVSRPRVWWSDVDWNHPTVTETLGPALKWKQLWGAWKILAPQEKTVPYIPQGAFVLERWQTTALPMPSMHHRWGSKAPKIGARENGHPDTPEMGEVWEGIPALVLWREAHAQGSDGRPATSAGRDQGDSPPHPERLHICPSRKEETQECGPRVACGCGTPDLAALVVPTMEGLWAGSGRLIDAAGDPGWHPHVFGFVDGGLWCSWRPSRCRSTWTRRTGHLWEASCDPLRARSDQTCVACTVAESRPCQVWLRHNGQPVATWRSQLRPFHLLIGSGQLRDGCVSPHSTSCHWSSGTARSVASVRTYGGLPRTTMGNTPGRFLKGARVDSRRIIQNVLQLLPWNFATVSVSRNVV